MTHLPAEGKEGEEGKEDEDVVGAGDGVVATVALGLAGGLKLQVAAGLARLATGIVVGKIGSAVARKAELFGAIAPATGALRKVVFREAAAE